MASKDERLYYIRLAKEAFQALPVTSAFLNNRKMIKTPEVVNEDTGEVIEPAVYYTSDDNLTLEQALRLYKPKIVQCYEETGGKPNTLGTLDTHETLPDECDYVLFGLNSPKLLPTEIFEMNLQLFQYNQMFPDKFYPPNHMLIPWGEDLNNYTQNGILPDA